MVFADVKGSRELAEQVDRVLRVAQGKGDRAIAEPQLPETVDGAAAGRPRDGAVFLSLVRRAGWFNPGKFQALRNPTTRPSARDRVTGRLHCCMPSA